MAKANHLSALINSLSTNEKRNFKLFSTFQAGEKKYVQLFELLDEDEKYSSAAIAKKLKLPGNQLPALKNYLGQVLISSLQIFTQPLTEEDILYKQLMEARVLMERNLFSHAMLIIDRSIIRARRMERFTILDNFLLAKHKCLFYLNRVQEAIALGSEFTEIAKILAEINMLRDLELRIKMVEMERKGITADIEEQIALLIPVEPGSMLSISAASYRFRILFYYYSIKGDATIALEIVRKEYAFYKKHPVIKEFDVVNYLLSFSHLYSAELFLRNFEKALHLSDTFLKLLDEKNLKCKESVKNTLKQHTVLRRIQILFYLKRMKDVITEAEKVYGSKLFDASHRFNITFKYASALIHEGRASEAIDRLNELIKVNIDMWVPLQQQLRALIIMAHIDLGNTRLVPYLVKSAKAWMKRKKYVNPELDAFFSYVTAAINSPTLKQRRNAFGAMLNSVKENKMPMLNEETALELWVTSKC